MHMYRCNARFVRKDSVNRDKPMTISLYKPWLPVDDMTRIHYVNNDMAVRKNGRFNEDSQKKPSHMTLW